MNLDTSYLAVLFRKSPKQLCQHALALTDDDVDEFWFVCGVIDAQYFRSLKGLRAASRRRDVAAARKILQELEAVL